MTASQTREPHSPCRSEAITGVKAVASWFLLFWSGFLLNQPWENMQRPSKHIQASHFDASIVCSYGPALPKAFKKPFKSSAKNDQNLAKPRLLPLSGNLRNLRSCPVSFKKPLKSSAKEDQHLENQHFSHFREQS